MLKKQKILKFERERFLLGIRKEDNKKVYLAKANWDCDWYWGFGYVNTFDRHDTYDHYHFDGLFLKGRIFESFKDYFADTTLDDDEIWALLGYMKEFYIMQKYAELMQYGNYITSRAVSVLEEKNKTKNKEEAERINKILIPELLEKIYQLLTIQKEGGQNEK